MHIKPQKQSQPPARAPKEWLWLLKTLVLRRKQKIKQQKQNPCSFLDLPLEPRIQVYNHAISGQDHNITKRRHGHRLPGLFHTHPLITQEIYQFCHITTIIDIAVPSLSSTRSMYNPITTVKVVVTVYKLLRASEAAREHRKSRGGKGKLSMKVKVRCLGCKMGECKGFNWGDHCWECVMFVHDWDRCEVGIEDVWVPDSFEFC